MSKQRYVWIDNAKIFACILVALGHFMQSMVRCGLMMECGASEWFDQTIYYFHVPVFFVCSGYLYQTTGAVHSISAWWKNIRRKALALGVPYFVFTVVTWGMKAAFPGDVNGANEGLLQTLFLNPESPYWYLYTLFGIFFILPNISGRTSAWAVLVISLAIKWVGWVLPDVPVYMISSVQKNAFWFALGMAMRFWGSPEKCQKTGRKAVVLVCSFLAASIAVYMQQWDTFFVATGMGLLGCMAVIFCCAATENRKWAQTVGKKLAGYTMPVFLMHTIFAAGTRTILLKLGIRNLMVHITAGIAASFIGPVLAFEVMRCLKLDVLIYPEKYRKQALKGNCQACGQGHRQE